MSKRRLIMYNDARHFHMYIYEPPMRLEDAWRPIDEIAGTAVDTFAYGFGVGPTMFHDTKVGEIWGTRFEKLPNSVDWRAYENIMSLIKRGHDPLNVILDRAHEKGLAFIGSLRLTHGSDPSDVETTHNWQFKIDNPQWCLTGPGKYSFNWVYPEVRAERFALIEETLNRYDVDGFEIDFAFSPYYFEPDEVDKNSHILTEFLRDVRRVANEAAARRGRRIELGARVLPTLEANLKVGFDLSAWLDEKMLDFLVPNVYGHLQTNAAFPFDDVLELAHAAGCEVYPALSEWIERDGRKVSGVEHYRGAAASYWRRGADALYLPWFRWPVGAEQRQILTEIADPQLLEERPKHYVVARNTPVKTPFIYRCPLPITLTKGSDAPGQIVPLYIADDPAKTSERVLSVRLSDATTRDSMSVYLNGEKLPESSRKTTLHTYQYLWHHYSLGPGILKRGHNEVGVALHRRPENLDSPVVLESVELQVRYANALNHRA